MLARVVHMLNHADEVISLHRLSYPPGHMRPPAEGLLPVPDALLPLHPCERQIGAYVIETIIGAYHATLKPGGLMVKAARSEFIRESLWEASMIVISFAFGALIWYTSAVLNGF